jgi:ABC-type multidrug transport system fused ATPase/permease subunit
VVINHGQGGYEPKLYNHLNHLNHLGAPFHHVPSPGLASPSASEAHQLGIEELHGSLAGAPTKTTDSGRSLRMIMMIIVIVITTTIVIIVIVITIITIIIVIYIFLLFLLLLLIVIIAISIVCLII